MGLEPLIFKSKVEFKDEIEAQNIHAQELEAQNIHAQELKTSHITADSVQASESKIKYNNEPLWVKIADNYIYTMQKSITFSIGAKEITTTINLDISYYRIAKEPTITILTNDSNVTVTKSSFDTEQNSITVTFVRSGDQSSLLSVEYKIECTCNVYIILDQNTILQSLQILNSGYQDKTQLKEILSDIDKNLKELQKFNLVQTLDLESENDTALTCACRKSGNIYNFYSLSIPVESGQSPIIFKSENEFFNNFNTQTDRYLQACIVSNVNTSSILSHGFVRIYCTNGILTIESYFASMSEGFLVFDGIIINSN